MELTLMLIVMILVISFLCEYMDATLGMGYGTTLTPLLLLMGFAPGVVVPAILVSQIVSNALASICHHREGNVNFRPNSRQVFQIRQLVHPAAYFKGVRQSFPMHLKVGLLFGGCGVIGAIIAVIVSVNIPKFWLNLYIGVLVLAMGLMILLMFNKQITFSYWKITGLGLFASFNKGLTGGGYGPIVCAGQILSGVQGKNAVGITALAEGITCLAAVVCYLLIGGRSVDWKLAPWVLIGAVLSVPLSAKSVKFIPERKLKAAIAVLTIGLGILTIYKTLHR
jgi:uncharacterized membrane protein YfcA